jgi:hypothetical protein
MGPKRKTQEEENLEGFEIQLEGTYRPIAPDPQFIERLKSRLVTPPQTVLEPPMIDRETVTVYLMMALLFFLVLTTGISITRLARRRSSK